MLHQANPQHRLQWVRRTAAFGTSLEMAGLDQIDQRLSLHINFHLNQNMLSLGAILSGPLLVITEPEILAARDLAMNCGYRANPAWIGKVIQSSHSKWHIRAI